MAVGELERGMDDAVADSVFSAGRGTAGAWRLAELVKAARVEADGVNTVCRAGIAGAGLRWVLVPLGGGDDDGIGGELTCGDLLPSTGFVGFTPSGMIVVMGVFRRGGNRGLFSRTSMVLRVGDTDLSGGTAADDQHFSHVGTYKKSFSPPLT